MVVRAGTRSAGIPGRGHSLRGQALIEFAILVPVVILLCLGGADLGRNLSSSMSVGASARAGLLMAVRWNGSDVGASIRNASSDLPDTTAVWGAAAVNQPYECAGTATATAKPCGDPGGCSTALDAAGDSPFWDSVPRPVACFSVGWCQVAATDPVTCAGSPIWPLAAATTSASMSSRLPPNDRQDAIVVRVVVERQPLTPLLSQFLPGGWTVVRADVAAYAAY